MIAAHNMISNHLIAYNCLNLQECFNEELTFATAGDTYHVSVVKFSLLFYYNVLISRHL